MTTIHFNIGPGTHSNTGMILNYHNGQANWQLEVQEPTSKDAIQEEITDSLINPTDETMEPGESNLEQTTGRLSQEETENPYLVFEELFGATSLPLLKRIVRDLCKIFITLSHKADLSEAKVQEAASTIIDQFDRLLEASWLLSTRIKNDQEEEAKENIPNKENWFENNYHIWSLLEDFYEQWNFYDAENRLWFMAKQIIANKDKEFIAEERNETADFYEKLKGVIQGAGELYEQYKEHSK